MKITIGKTNIYIDPKALREAHRLVVSTLNSQNPINRSLSSAAATLERLQTALARENDEEVEEEEVVEDAMPHRKFTGLPLGIRHYIQQRYAALMQNTPPTEANKTNTRMEAVLCALEELVHLHAKHTEDIVKLTDVVSHIREADLRRSKTLRTVTEALA